MDTPKKSKWKRFVGWLKEHLTVGEFTDFEDAKECDPNEPCREVEPQKVKGAKIKIKF